MQKSEQKCADCLGKDKRNMQIVQENLAEICTLQENIAENANCAEK